MKLRRYKISSSKKKNLRTQSVGSMHKSTTTNKDNNRKNEVRHKDFNVVDPIMLGPLEKHTFKFKRPNGTTIVFNLESLIDYLVSSGDFTDPETRIPFSDEDLKEIDRLVQDSYSYSYLRISTYYK